MKSDPLSITFSALADPTRRAILARLARGRGDGQRAGGAVRDEPALGVPPSQGARAGGAGRQGEVRPVAPLPPQRRPARDADAWMAPYRGFFEARFAPPQAATGKETDDRRMMTKTQTRADFTIRGRSSPSGGRLPGLDRPEHLEWFANPAQAGRRSRSKWTSASAGSGDSRWCSRDTAYPTGGVYREIVRDEKLVFVGRSRRLPRTRPRPPR